MPVSKPVQQEVTDYVDFTGRTDAVQAVNVVARVTGYLVQMPFKEGSEVKKDQLLFEIDPRPYQDQLTLGQAQLATYKAQQQLADANFVRATPTHQGQDRSVSKNLSNTSRRRNRPPPRSSPPKQTSRFIQLNLEFTRVTSPIDGQVSRYYLTLGNLVNQDQTLLTTVVSLDPMYAYFDMDEPTLLRVRQGDQRGEDQAVASGEQIPVLMGLQGEDGFPHAGTINFVNNQVNPATGSISVRGVFPNPDADEGRAAAVARHVRADPAADRPAAPGAAGHRPGHRLGPGAEIRLRGRCQEQGPVSPRRRPGRSRRTGSRVDPERAEAGRLGRRRRIAAGPARHRRSSPSQAMPMPTLGRQSPTTTPGSPAATAPTQIDARQAGARRRR